MDMEGGGGNRRVKRAKNAALNFERNRARKFPHSVSPSRPFQTSFYPSPLIPFLSPLAGYPSVGRKLLLSL